MNWYLLGVFTCMCLTIPTLAKSEDKIKRYGENIEKVEIELDFVDGNAFITYNDKWKTTAKISYEQKKKIVAYRDDESGHCLLEKITKHKEKNHADGELSSKVYHFSQASLEKIKAEKLAGKRLIGFCGKYPITLLKEYSVKNDRRPEGIQEENRKRAKRESDLIRGVESHLSHQEISKKLLEDLAIAESLAPKGISRGKGVKRNVDDGTGHGRGHHPSASAKVGQPATVDYHARISNNLPSGGHPMHPIDITSSVTIATGAAHPVWSYPPSSDSHHAQNMSRNDYPGQGIPSSHATPHHSPAAHQNTTQSHHYGHLQPPGVHSIHQGVPPHPSSSGQSFRTSGYYPPSSTSKSQQSTASYSPSSASKSQPSSPHYPPSSFSKPQQNAAYYPPSSTSKSEQVPAHFPPSSATKSHQGPAFYPPSSSSKPHHRTSPSPQPSLAYYPPSSTSKNRNETAEHREIHSSKFPTAAHLSPSASSSQSHSHGYHPSYIPPSSTSKIQFSVPQPRNTSLHHGVMEAGRDTYAPQFPPSSTSKVYHQQAQYGTAGRTGIPQYPPSPTSSLQHSTPSRNHEGPQEQMHGIAQYPPSSTSKVPQPGSFYAPQFPPSSTSKLHYSPGARDSSYGQTPVLERPTARGNAQEPGSYPPSSTSKVHYSPHSHVMPAGGNIHGVQYYHPSSSSQVHYSPSSSGHDPSSLRVHPPPQYPPSSTSKVHYSQSPMTPAQIPQPPTDRNLMASFPPSSTSKLHPSPSHHPHHYPLSSSSKLSQGVGPQGQHHQHPPTYYPPSSTSKLHQTSGAQQNFSTTKQSSSLGYFPPSSMSKPHHSPLNHRDVHTGDRVTATGRVSVTSGFAQYPPSSSGKNPLVQQGSQHISPPHLIQEYPYYGPSSSAHHHNVSVGQGSSGVPPSSSGHGLYPPAQYPPSSTSKIHPSHQQNGSVADHNMHAKPFYAMEQHPSSSGQHQPTHHNDSSSGQFSHPVQGAYYPPSGHHSPIGEYHPQYPPSSSSHNHQQSLGSSSTQFYQGLPPSSQGSHATIRPCQSSPRSLYSITTRTIVTPNGAIQRPVSVKNNGEYPCGSAVPPVSYARYAPCSGTLTRNGQTVRPQISCTANGNLRKAMRNNVPGLAVISDRNTPQHVANNHNIRTGSEQYDRGYGHSGVLTSVNTQTELLHGQGHPISHHGSHFSKLQAATPENSTSNGEKEDTTAPEYFEENGRSGKDVEVFERSDAEDRAIGKPVKYQENEPERKGQTNVDSEEEVKEGDVLEPGDRILGKDGYTISDGFRGRVVSVTGQVAKTRAESGKDTQATIPQDAVKKSNSGQFKYSSDLGRYVKENGEKNYSNCHGEPTFTCSEFLGSNGRAKICKPNPRRNPDGSPC